MPCRVRVRFSMRQKELEGPRSDSTCSEPISGGPWDCTASFHVFRKVLVFASCFPCVPPESLISILDNAGILSKQQVCKGSASLNVFDCGFTVLLPRPRQLTAASVRRAVPSSTSPGTRIKIQPPQLFAHEVQDLEFCNNVAKLFPSVLYRDIKLSTPSDGSDMLP